MKRYGSTRLPILFVVVVMLAAVTASCGGDDDDDSDDSADAATSIADSAPKDPLPEFDTPGIARCDGCPLTESITDFEPTLVGVSSQVFSGKVDNASGNGTFYVESESREAFSGTIETDPATGNFSVNVPLVCGEQTVKLAWSNDAGTAGVVLTPTTTDCVDSDIRITLAWDDRGSDFELHLIREGGRIYSATDDCTWTTCIGIAPDWGRAGDDTDNPSKDVDDTGTFGPENIVYPDPADGRYTVIVEHWGGGQPGATGAVTINVAGQAPVQLDIDGLDSQHVVTVATIDWPEGTVTAVDTEYDCTAEWNRGCTAALP